MSRTFALTIPALPPELELAVANAYLLCRAADTIEDAPTLTEADAVAFGERLLAVLDERASADAFARDLVRAVGPGATLDERSLLAELPSVLRITASLPAAQRAAVVDCLRTMTNGMALFRRHQSRAGLPDLQGCAAYCYAVAGVVGEMLTRLFVIHAPELEPRRGELLELGVAFGRALQLTNILKDTWEDRARGVCWLPRSTFADEGLDLVTLEPGDPRLVGVWRRLVGLARVDLEAALAYTLALPARETGMRNFCAWSLLMAALTLQNIVRRPAFGAGADVKIGRNTVALVVAYCRLAVRSDRWLEAAFATATLGLPWPDPRDRAALTSPAREPARVAAPSRAEVRV